MISVEKRLVEEVRKHDTLIIVGETGSGKTTRMIYLCNFLICCIVNSQPHLHVSIALNLMVFL